VCSFHVDGEKGREEDVIGLLGFPSLAR